MSTHRGRYLTATETATAICDLHPSGPCLCPGAESPLKLPSLVQRGRESLVNEDQCDRSLNGMVGPSMLKMSLTLYIFVYIDAFMYA